MGKNIFYFVIALAVLLLVGGVVFMLTQRAAEPQELPSPTLSVEQEEGGLGSELNQNPGSEIPETNPFEAETNPFEGYTNPFE
jgi:hypothetical protein